MIQVMLVDDQVLVRTGFRMIIDETDDITVVAEAANGAEALDLARRTRPDVVLMDVRMPVMDGIEATRRLCHPTRPSDPPRIIILTTFDLDEYVFAGLQAGASGFLFKDALAADLLAAVRVVAAGQAVAAPTVTRRLIEHFTSAIQSPAPDTSRLDALTMRERQASPSSHADYPTARSPRRWSCPRAQSRPTSTASSPNSTYATGSKPSSSDTKPAW